MSVLFHQKRNIVYAAALSVVICFFTLLVNAKSSTSKTTFPKLSSSVKNSSTGKTVGSRTTLKNASYMNYVKNYLTNYYPYLPYNYGYYPYFGYSYGKWIKPYGIGFDPNLSAYLNGSIFSSQYPSLPPR